MAQLTPEGEKTEPCKRWRDEEEEGWRPADLQSKSQEHLERVVCLHHPETGCFVKIIRIRLGILCSMENYYYYYYLKHGTARRTVI